MTSESSVNTCASPLTNQTLNLILTLTVLLTAFSSKKKHGIENEKHYTFFTASCETFLPLSASAFLIMALYKCLPLSLSLLSIQLHILLHVLRIQRKSYETMLLHRVLLVSDVAVPYPRSQKWSEEFV